MFNNPKIQLTDNREERLIVTLQTDGISLLALLFQSINTHTERAIMLMNVNEQNKTQKRQVAGNVIDRYSAISQERRNG
jgi:hypothetical protein